MECEFSNNQIFEKLLKLEKKLDKLIPVIRDVSKHLAEAKQTANKGKPPRKQPKKKEIKKTGEDCFNPSSKLCLENDDCLECPKYKP